ncbi:HDL456Wp [Eremothecium sinecaudum]|uniref:N-acetylglucosaminylphosphatidylinositol deacetylase n=1 Tax=Eremothecium sinecaudum TaxID=45286 RepID=A0A0X8HRX6_9SACH|nr:HDL456Wp [Eremothecium sinecaudum]AMD20288.1 HDL456Wp [Eremothecium sinecaudum]
MFGSFFAVLKLYMVFIGLYCWSYKRLEDHNVSVYNNLIGTNRHTSLTIVIAHPDDEVMFFAPTLLQLDNLMDSSIPFKVICLTDGDSDGLGAIRRTELKKALQVLVLNHRVVLEVGDLTDGMEIEWEKESVRTMLRGYIKDSNPLILTFDERGVSGHKNHIACANAINDLAYKQLHLKTGKNILRKYSGFIVDLVRLLLGYPLDTVFISTALQYLHSLVAMLVGHKSQMVWFRWGWWVLSRYVFANEY